MRGLPTCSSSWPASTSRTIEVIKDGERVDGKSILAILTLAAVQGTQLRIEATGPDADAALVAIADLFQRDFEVNGNVE